ncbi:MAG TPA: (E)-4-hydroxy-3-methylbut-2-enyl-diphosphate synthase [Bacteroidales bacterium]|nr:(E)-4-hydroxy-3-methylbut-2-enyl-diphosphate synthase [Bacteroidales bacterium]
MTNFQKYIRFQTRVVHIGNVPMGGEYPVRVQSMTNTDTLDTKATVEQAVRMIKAGCEYVRISVPGMKEAENLRNIKSELHRKGFTTPLIADVHFNPKIAEKAAAIVEKVRINPGNFDITRFRSLIAVCKKHGTALRIGVNHGSLSQKIMNLYGDTPEGMAESALEFVRICREEGFHELVLSLKSSNTRVMIRSNRLLVEKMKKEGMDYPIHLGVTEAGAGEDGRIRSAIGIGSLLADGIGDTIRVSITEDPEFEIPVAYSILQSVGVRITKTEYISCPSCARTHFDIQETLRRIREKTSHLSGLKIAVMGCIVNGPGEMADADYGYVGAGKGKVMLYRKQERVKKNIPEENAVEELIRLIRDHGDWKDPSSV